MASTVQSVERAAALLQLLGSETEPLPLAQIVNSLGLAKGTAHGLLRTLQHVGFVEQDPGTARYRVGAGLLQLGATPLDLNELKARALNWADALAARSGESVRVAAFRSGSVVVAHHVFRAGGGRQQLEAGSTVPLHAHALGKVLLAFDPAAARSIAGAKLESHTFRTITTRGPLMAELAEIRDHGFAIDVGETDTAEAGIAVPIRDRSGYVVASVGISGAVERICDSRSRPQEKLVDLVVGTGRSISREFGHGRVR